LRRYRCVGIRDVAVGAYCLRLEIAVDEEPKVAVAQPPLHGDVMPCAVENRRCAANCEVARPVAGHAEDDLAAGDRDPEFAIGAGAIAVDDDVPRGPSLICAARHRRCRVLRSARHQPELKCEVSGADVRGRPGERCYRVVDPDLDAVDVTGAGTEKAQRMTGRECAGNTLHGRVMTTS